MDILGLFLVRVRERLFRFDPFVDKYHLVVRFVPLKRKNRLEINTVQYMSAPTTDFWTSLKMNQVVPYRSSSLTRKYSLSPIPTSIYLNRVKMPGPHTPCIARKRQ